VLTDWWGDAVNLTSIPDFISVSILKSSVSTFAKQYRSFSSKSWAMIQFHNYMKPVIFFERRRIVMTTFRVESQPNLIFHAVIGGDITRECLWKGLVLRNLAACRHITWISETELYNPPSKPPDTKSTERPLSLRLPSESETAWHRPCSDTLTELDGLTLLCLCTGIQNVLYRVNRASIAIRRSCKRMLNVRHTFQRGKDEGSIYIEGKHMRVSDMLHKV